MEKKLLGAHPAAISSVKDKDAEKKEVESYYLYQKVGQLQIEVDWLRKLSFKACIYRII